MNGWTPDMVMRLPVTVHRALVAMLQADDEASQPKSDNPFQIPDDLKP